MADISYEPIFTYKGLNKISKALQDSSTIQLTHLALGDAKDSLDYNVSPSAESLNNEIIRISISTIAFTDVVASNNVLMHIEGLLTPQDSPNMVIREYGIYDNEGDLLIICRYPDYHTMQTGMPITNMIFKSDIYLVNNAAAFTEDYYGSGDHTTVEEFNTHVLNYNNPHNVDHTHIPGLENLDNTSPEMKPFNQNNKDLFTDGKFAIGFVDRTSSRITNTSDTISLIKTDVNTNISIYRYGVRYEIENDLSLTINPDSSGYIGYSIENNELYFIGENPNFTTDILVAWYYSNPIDGIIWLNDERHSVTRNVEYHKLTHNTTGTIWKYGGELTTSDFTKLNIANFGIADEDLEFDISHAAVVVNDFTQVLIDAKLPVLYVANGKYRRAFNNNTLNWLYNGSGAVYNDINNGGLITVADNKYLTYIVLFTPSIKEPVKLVVGIGEYDTENAAENESFESYGLSMPELVAAYRIILHKNNAYSNLAKTKITKIVKIRSLNDGGKADLTNHNLFTDRFEGIQHPTSAIIGLDQALAEAGKLKDIELVGTMKSKLAVDEITREATLTTFQSDSTNMPAIYGGGNPNGESRVLVSDFGDTFAPDKNHFGLTLARNGKLYGAPTQDTMAIEIDPEKHTTTRIGTVYGTVANKWQDGILAPNGKIYYAPSRANKVLKLDPDTRSTTLVGIDYLDTTYSKWYGMAIVKDGRIYCTPSGKDRILRIDPSIDETYMMVNLNLGLVADTNKKYISACTGVDNQVYMFPYVVTSNIRIIKLNPGNQSGGESVSFIPTTYNNICNACLAPDGHIYLSQDKSSLGIFNILKFNTLSKEISLVATLDVANDGLFFYLTVGPNGNIYSMSYKNTNNVLEIDTKTDEVFVHKTKSLATIDFAGCDQCLAPNGKIYLDSYYNSKCISIDIFPKSVDFQKYLKLP